MKISAAQMRMFEKAAWESFERRLVEHWRGSFPHRCSTFSDEHLREVARAAIRDAREKGIESEQDVVVYVDLALVAGADFAASLLPSRVPVTERP